MDVVSPMTPYGNRSGNSGVRAYSLGGDWIEVMFKSGDVYRYTTRSTGSAEIAAMKELAIAGKGLGTFISQHVKSGYESRRRGALRHPRQSSARKD